VPLLEHHYWRSDREDKKREYLRLAAEAAQASYANAAAVVYLERLVPLVDGADRVDAMLRLSKVLQLTGEVARSEQLLLEAREVAVQLGDERRVGRTDHGLAETARRLGRFDDASARLAMALSAFTATEDEAGIGDVHHLRGTVASQGGDRATARDAYLESMAIRERLGDRAGVAAMATNLGVVAIDGGEVADARETLERGREIYRELGDRRGMVLTAGNLAWVSLMAADAEGARAYAEETISLAREIGDRLNIAIGQNNLASALRLLGQWEAAGTEYATVLETYRELDDRWSMTFLLEDIALLAAGSGQADDAFRLYGAADGQRIEIGAPRAPSLQQDLDARLAPARASLDHDAVARAVSDGVAMSLEEGIALALLVCERTRI